MRLLYMSCHSVLERDEVALFHELGINVFSPGAYVEPRNPGDGSLRPGIAGLEYDPADLAAWHKLCGEVGGDGKDRLSKEFVDRFDAVLVMHIPHWITGNWENIKHKRVIWRTIGQSMPHQEMSLQPYRAQGLKIVRYSPRESGLEHFAGSDAMIRFYKDPQQFAGWTGERQVIVNFTQSMPKRREACNYDLFLQVTNGLPSEIYGPGNEEMGATWKGRLSYDDLCKTLREARAYFYTGTHPASYTLNATECLMTGTPMVAIGPRHGNAPFHKRPDNHGNDAGCLYEMGDIIRHGENGFISDRVAVLRDCLTQLLTNPALAAKISAAGRATALELFGKDVIREQWRAFFASLT